VIPSIISGHRFHVNWVIVAWGQITFLEVNIYHIPYFGVLAFALSSERANRKRLGVASWVPYRQPVRIGPHYPLLWVDGDPSCFYGPLQGFHSEKHHRSGNFFYKLSYPDAYTCKSNITATSALKVGASSHRLRHVSSGFLFFLLMMFSIFPMIGSFYNFLMNIWFEDCKTKCSRSKSLSFRLFKG
jgi:hypothetical protein